MEKISIRYGSKGKESPIIFIQSLFGTKV